jgi:Flp pilus assembly protein TadG
LTRLLSGASAGGRRRGRRHGESGNAAVEFALVLPLLLTVMFAIIELGYCLFNYQMLTGAARVGARNFAVSRATTTTPYATTRSVISTAANGLKSATLLAAGNITLAVAGTTCASDAACVTALVQGATATVTVKYPCSIVVMGVNALPSCTLTQTDSEIVE